MTRRVPAIEDEAGLRYAMSIADDLLERCNQRTKALSFDEGWKLGIEEVRYRITWDLFYLSCKTGRDVE